MIGGAVTGGGGPALGRHLVNPDHNDDVRAGSSRGLMAEMVDGQVAELTDMAEASGHKAPLRHVHASPPPGVSWDGDQWDAYWALYEQAMGLEGCAFSEAIHDKHGADGRPPHRHRVYLALTERGTLVRIGHDYAKQEAVSRITEHDTGAAFVRGAHNVRAATFARQLGRDDVVDAMQAAGLLDGARARADLSPMDRAQQERTHVSKRDVAATVAQAWAASDGGPAFAAALAEQGLRLARGEKCPVVVDATGNIHAVTRMLNMAAKADGQLATRAADVAARLDGVALPSVAEAREAVAAPPTPPDATPPSPGAPTPHGGGPGRDIASAMRCAADVAHAYIHADAELQSPCADHAGHIHAPIAQAAPSAALEDAGPGPGEPPGPTAHPDELARYRAALHAHAERKHAALQSFMRSMSAAADARHQATTTGGHHGTVQQPTAPSWERWWPAAVGTAVAAGYTAEEARAAISSTGIVARDGTPVTHGTRAEPRHDHTGGGEGQRHPTGGEGREREQRPGRDPVATDDGAGASGERGLGGGEGAAGGHRGAADRAGWPPGQDRVQAYRAARSLDTLNLSGLRDRLNPGRMAMREAERIRAGADMPEYTAVALDRLMDRVHARDPATLADLRQDGFHEMLRMEQLRVIMDADDAARAGMDSRPQAVRPWSPTIR